MELNRTDIEARIFPLNPTSIFVVSEVQNNKVHGKESHKNIETYADSIRHKKFFYLEQKRLMI